eukprot:TRINITY_DN279_c0_g1_i1.p1 TRINITY_DN279_c0_g1~~TRINITY_DN279_c0_g1_i1.p1  ORF type:complete len:209 (-),score=47.07 TRINITY_DN279_c0_g1_i1:51-677(-)
MAKALLFGAAGFAAMAALNGDLAWVAPSSQQPSLGESQASLHSHAAEYTSTAQSPDMAWGSLALGSVLGFAVALLAQAAPAYAQAYGSPSAQALATNETTKFDAPKPDSRRAMARAGGYYNFMKECEAKGSCYKNVQDYTSVVKVSDKQAVVDAKKAQVAKDNQDRKANCKTDATLLNEKGAWTAKLQQTQSSGGTWYCQNDLAKLSP